VRAVTFASPYLLLALLLVPAALAFALWVDRRRARYTVSFTNLDVLASVAEASRSTWRRWLPLALFLVALAAASTALARPHATVSTASSRATVVLLIDVSGSMRAADVKPSRLGAAQAAMYGFLDHVPPGVRVGLVSFSTAPDVLVLPTTDRSMMREGVDLLEPEAGTAIGDGVKAAVDVALSSVGPHAPRGRNGKIPAAIVLLSDGAQTRGALQPLQGAQFAKNAGIPVYTIALGTNHGTLGLGAFGGFGFSPSGSPGARFPVRPDPGTLRAIAQVTGGTAYRAQSAAKVQNVYRKLSGAVVTHTKRREISSWFAGAAAFLLLGSLGAAKLTGDRLP
jgi:Ca-activated chloride channel family protein